MRRVEREMRIKVDTRRGRGEGGSGRGGNPWRRREGGRSRFFVLERWGAGRRLGSRKHLK